ncbi:MAG: ubiquitin-like small modifier protein 1 [Salinirussus sp.]
MQWKLFATLAESAQREVTLSTDGETTLREAVDALIEIHPELEGELFDEAGELHDHVRLLHEGQDAFAEKSGWETPVDEGDELAAFPPVSGG